MRICVFRVTEFYKENRRDVQKIDKDFKVIKE